MFREKNLDANEKSRKKPRKSWNGFYNTKLRAVSFGARCFTCKCIHRSLGNLLCFSSICNPKKSAAKSDI